jgi:hypothetical protein
MALPDSAQDFVMIDSTSLIHAHMTLLWTLVLGVVGSVLGGVLPCW